MSTTSLVAATSTTTNLFALMSALALVAGGASSSTIASSPPRAHVPDYMHQLHAQHRAGGWRRFVADIAGVRKTLGVVTSIRSHRHLGTLQLQTSSPSYNYVLLLFNHSSLDHDEFELARELRIHSNSKQDSHNDSASLYDINYLNEATIRRFIETNETFQDLPEWALQRPVYRSFLKDANDGWTSYELGVSRERQARGSTVYYLLREEGATADRHTRFRRSVLPSKAPHLVTFNRHRSVPTPPPPATASPPMTTTTLGAQRGGVRRRRRRRRKRQKWRQARRLAHTSYCRRRSLYVDFGAIGWNTWIVAPRGYNADMCQGSCPFPLDDNFRPTNHAIIQQLVHFYQPGNVAPPCCVPTKLAPESLLYFDESNQVVLKVYQDMSVEMCGCR